MGYHFRYITRCKKTILRTHTLVELKAEKYIPHFMYILGISCFYHESAAALVKDGEIIAASEEERFSRKKHDSSFPKQSIKFCLEQAEIQISDIDYVVFYEKPFRKFERNLLLSLTYFPGSFTFFVDFMKNFLTEKLWAKLVIIKELQVNPNKVFFVPHHLSHAAASYYPSPFTESAFLTLDGVGEWTTGSYGYGSQNKLYPMGEMKFPDSIGLLYSAFTAFLGFEVNDGEYKVMGMAAYGKPIHLSKVKKLYQQAKDGSIKLHLKYFAFHKSAKSMYSKEFTKLFDGLDRFDVAASLQRCVEEMVFTILKYVFEKTNKSNLVMGGGVALNSVINGKIINETQFKNIFIFPAAGDDGGAVGAALYLYYHVLNFKKRKKFQHAFLGKGINDREINTLIKKHSLKMKRLQDNKLYEHISSQLSQGKVVGWFEGRAEFGPRALGHRSILADPRNAKMKDIVNAKIKFREEFRPFAPVVLSEYKNEYFSISADNLSPFMLGTFEAKFKAKKDSPATVHEDGTSRVQVVDKNYPGKYRELIIAFFKKTGVPILLNTSFNVKGEPIVNSPEDAYKTFISSGIDILVLENYVLEK